MINSITNAAPLNILSPASQIRLINIIWEKDPNLKIFYSSIIDEV